MKFRMPARFHTKKRTNATRQIIMKGNCPKALLKGKLFFYLGYCVGFFRQDLRAECLERIVHKRITNQIRFGGRIFRYLIKMRRSLSSSPHDEHFGSMLDQRSSLKPRRSNEHSQIRSLMLKR